MNVSYAMKKMSGWQKAGLIAGVGCLSIVGLLIVALVGGVIWARSALAEYGDTTSTRNERTFSLAPGAELTIDLEEANFDVRPGAPAGQVQVQGTWPSALYELTEEQQPPRDGVPRTRIRFRAKAPAMARILSGIVGATSSDERRVTVLLPEGTAHDLALGVSMGESRVDLGGLSLGELSLDLAMGDHRVDFSRPSPSPMRRLRLNSSMGEVSIGNIGNARPAVIEGRHSMGNLTADFGGAWPAGGEATATFDQSMGEMRLRVPGGIRLQTEFIGREDDAAGPAEGNETAAPTAPLVRLRVSSSMGDRRVIRY